MWLNIFRLYFCQIACLAPNYALFAFAKCIELNINNNYTFLPPISYFARVSYDSKGFDSLLLWSSEIRDIEPYFDGRPYYNLSRFTTLSDTANLGSVDEKRQADITNLPWMSNDTRFPNWFKEREKKFVDYWVYQGPQNLGLANKGAVRTWSCFSNGAAGHLDLQIFLRGEVDGHIKNFCEQIIKSNFSTVITTAISLGPGAKTASRRSKPFTG